MKLNSVQIKLTTLHTVVNRPCFVVSVGHGCTNREFYCMADMSCIDINHLCDGSDDCSDGEDETGCGMC